MGTLKIASSAALAFAALLGCGPKAAETSGTPTACLAAVNKSFVDGVRSCEGRVAQADERARQAHERSLPLEPVPVLEITPLGAVLPGSPWSTVKDFRRSDNCATAPETDCLVTDNLGVEYWVFDGSVGTVAAREASSGQVALPYGLKFGDSPPGVVGKLISSGPRMSWLIAKAPDDYISLHGAEEFKGADGGGFTLSMLFHKSRLVEVEYYRQVI